VCPTLTEGGWGLWCFRDSEVNADGDAEREDKQEKSVDGPQRYAEA
jgi:hypothetical protein